MEDTITRICGGENNTSAEAKRLFRQAQLKTAPGSGFEIGQDRIGLPAVCALLASTRLNNTLVTPEAARSAACLNKNKFKKLQDIVISALALDSASVLATALTFQSLRSKHCATLSTRCLRWMDLVEKEMDGVDQDATDDEMKIAIFIWVCDVIQPNEPLDIHAFKTQYRARLGKLRSLNKAIEEQSGDKTEDILKDLASVRPTRASTSSPQKRTLLLVESPSKRQKLGAGASTSPTKTKAVPSRPRSPTQSPTKGTARALSSSDEEDDGDELPAARRRRFRPVFRDSVQWGMRDPRLKEIDAEAKALGERMVKLYGRPFQDAWRAIEESQDEDVEMGE